MHGADGEICGLHLPHLCGAKPHVRGERVTEAVVRLAGRVGGGRDEARRVQEEGYDNPKAEGGVREGLKMG